MLYYIKSYHIISYHIISYHIILYYILFHSILFYFIIVGVCLPYYRHPSSAACFLAPSGGNLRGFVGFAGFAGCPGYRGFFIGRFARAPPKSLLRIGEFSEKREVSVGEIWPLRGHFGIYSERIHKEPYREMGSTVS